MMQKICQSPGHEHLLAVFECKTCGPWMCYACAEAHQDQAHEVVGGVRGIDSELESPRNEKNKLFNEGAECVLHLDQLKCPCGQAFLESEDSAICCVCGTATCSDACHKKYVQEKGLCLYTRNYLPMIEERRQGCRCIRHDEMTGQPGQYLSDVCGPRFVEAEVLDKKTLKIRRGYSQFGQPLPETLEAIEIIDADPKKSKNPKRQCLCPCPECTSKAMHPIHGHKNSLYKNSLD